MVHTTLLCKEPVAPRLFAAHSPYACRRQTRPLRMQASSALSSALGMYSLLPKLPIPNPAHPLRTQPSSAISKSPLGVYSLLTKLP